MKITLLVCAGLILSSCAFHSGTYSSTPLEQPMYYKDIALGVSSAKRFFGIGGISKDALIYEARQNMQRNRPLEGNEIYNNTSVDIKTTHVGFFNKTKVTVISDVLAPKDSITQESYSQHYLNTTQSITVTEDLNFEDELFTIGDSVIFNLAHSAELIGFDTKGKDKAVLKYYTSSGDVRTKTVKLKRLFTIIPSYKGYSLGDHLTGGKIIAFGRTSALVQDNDGDILHFPYLHSVD